MIGNGSGYTLAQIGGTTNQLTVTSGSGSITLSLPNSVAMPGSLSVTTTFGATGAATFSNTVNVTGLMTVSNLNGATANVATLNVSGNATIQGDLVVNGNLTTLDVANIAVEDPLIFLARNNNSSDSVDIGLYWHTRSLHRILPRRNGWQVEAVRQHDSRTNRHSRYRWSWIHNRHACR